MPFVLMWCLTIVAAFPLQLAAAPAPIARVTVPASVAALAERLGMDIARDRGRFAPEIIRRIYSPPASRQVPLNLGTVSTAADDSPSATLVDVPLSPEIWSRAVFKRAVPANQLLAVILADRRAALLCRGLAAADDETLTFYAEHPSLLFYFYERAPGAFAAFADSFHVRDRRMVVPGGDLAATLWLTAVHADTGDADAFLRALLFEPEGRLGYLYEVLATASPGARDFALGAWIDDAALRARRFDAMALAVHSSFREWHVEELPFGRPLNDLAILLLRIRVGERGIPTAPARRRFWALVLDANPALDSSGDTASATHLLVDAAWLLQATAGDMYTRGDKLEQFAFGQRVFGAHPDGESDAAAAVLREMPTRRMLLLGLERLGITAPDVYALAERQARAAIDGGSNRFWTVAQQQGALALLTRMTLNGSLSQRNAESLVRSLFALPLSGGEYRGALAEWLEDVLGPQLPRAEDWQARAIAAAAGGPTPGNPRIEWEGQTYRLDLAFAERKRIEDIRSRQGGPDLDVALAIARLARRGAQATSPEAAQALAAAAQDLLASSGAVLVRPAASSMAAGVPVPRDPREWLQRATEDIDRGARANDVRRVTKGAESLAELGDVILGHAMLSLVYAVHLGDPDGPALLGANVALRHDFGIGRREGEGRARGPWAQPRQDFQPGVPWHVTGALVGLDVALAPLSLHRLSMDGLATPPRLQSIEREAFAVNVALLNARQLRDVDRAKMMAAIARGRARVRSLASSSPVEFEKLENDLALDGWRVRTLRWVLQNEPASIENQFSLAELLTLGDPASAFDSWGASGLLPYGCLCTRFPQPRTWRILAGRTQLAMMAASTVEMNLEMAQRLSAMQLPAALLPSVLATAMQDFVDQVDSADSNDLSALVQFPRELDRNLVADYVAATATLDGPLVSIDAVDTSEP